MALDHQNQSTTSDIFVKNLGLTKYDITLRAMQEFTSRREINTSDELWVLEHTSAYTLGQSGNLEDLFEENNPQIPVIKSDRGGQITYHGPGQLIIYTLLDLRRRGESVRTLVRKLEHAMIQLLGRYGVKGHGSVSKPGVYVNDAKIGSLGLRIKRGCCYHGLALNVNMDLTPFSTINPCGYPGLKVTQLSDLGVNEQITSVRKKLLEELILVL